MRPTISKEDWQYQAEFTEWWTAHGHKWDKEEDPEGETYIQIKWWTWEAWRAARRVKT